MSSTVISALVFTFVLAGAVLGSFLRSVLPKHHLSEESQEAIKVGTGLISTLVALVLGLLVASAKGSFDTKSEELKESAAKAVLLDRTLRRLGPPALLARSELRRALEFRLELPWGQANFRALGTASSSAAPTLEDVEDHVRLLTISDDSQHWLQTRALQLSTELTQTRWLLAEQATSDVSMPFVVVVVSWLAIIFASFGLLAPRNLTVWVVIVLCAVAVSTAVLLILELDQPFQGLITLSKQPLRDALFQMGR